MLLVTHLLLRPSSASAHAGWSGNITGRNCHTTHQLIYLLIIASRNLNVPRYNRRLVVVTRRITSKLRNLHHLILHHLTLDTGYHPPLTDHSTTPFYRTDSYDKLTNRKVQSSVVGLRLRDLHFFSRHPDFFGFHWLFILSRFLVVDNGLDDNGSA